MSEDQPTWTIEAVLRWTTSYFREKTSASPRLDAELLLAHTLGCERLQLYLQADRPLTEAERAAYRDLVRQRAQGSPVAYLLGYRDFWNLRLSVGPGVLIPRPDTETLVEAALDHLPETPLTLLELGTGTAAIPLALCAERFHWRWLCLERSTEALEWAQKNCKNHAALLMPRHNHLQLLQVQGFSALRQVPQFDALISNPPYIASQTVPTLSTDVARFEPLLALDGGVDGLNWYREFLELGPQWLYPKGWLLTEIGFEQQEPLTQLLQQHPEWELVEFRKDLQGHPRVLVARLR